MIKQYVPILGFDDKFHKKKSSETFGRPMNVLARDFVHMTLMNNKLVK